MEGMSSGKNLTQSLQSYSALTKEGQAVLPGQHKRDFVRKEHQSWFFLSNTCRDFSIQKNRYFTKNVAKSYRLKLQQFAIVSLR